MQPSWLSILPSIIVIATMAITRKLNISLFLGIVTASLIAAHGSIYVTLSLIGERTAEHFMDINNIYLYLSLITISSLITLLTTTGSAAACARIISKKIHTKRGIQTSSIMLSFILSIDDYLSILTTGLVMRPLADHMAVSRAKLAYLVHSLSGPLVILMPISTWAATILAQLENAGVNLSAQGKIIADPFFIYLSTIPFIFYSIISTISVLFVVYKKISYGPLGKLEEKAISHTDNQESKLIQNEQHTLIELILPMITLVGGTMLGILYSGGYYLFGGNNSFIDAFRQNTAIFFVLLITSVCALITSTLLAFYKKIITLPQTPRILFDGAILMHGPISMVILASILGSFLRINLQTGHYVALTLLSNTAVQFIPVILFTTALLITLATGSAWGTFSLLIPITTQMLISFLQLTPPLQLSQITLLLPTLGAILSGAVCGDHISPFSETTTMTGLSTGIGSGKHAYTQFFYALPVIIGSFTAFIISGILYKTNLTTNFCVSGMTGLLISITLLTTFNTIWKN